MDIRNFLLVAIVGLCMNAEGVAAGRGGDKAISEMFAEDRVASFISAVTNGDYAGADKLVKEGININAVGVDGVSPLIWIMGTTLDIRKIEYMLKNGADPNYRDHKRQVSAMYFAAGGDRPDILELLLKNKGNPNLFGPSGKTLMMIAVGQFRDKNIELLLKYGADISINDNHKNTVANYAAALGRFDLVAHFLDLGLNYNLQGLGRTVEIRQVSQDSEQQRWKDKVIDMLKARGVKFPAFTP